MSSHFGRKRIFQCGKLATLTKSQFGLIRLVTTPLRRRGTKEVIIKTSGCEKQSVTVIFVITADWSKLPPFLIFKRKACPKTLKNENLFPDDVLIRNQEKGWMTESLMLEWLRNVWERRPCGLSNPPSILCLDTFRDHLTNDVKKKMHSLGSDLVIPGGMTSVLQTLDVSINKPFNPLRHKETTILLC